MMDSSNSKRIRLERSSSEEDNSEIRRNKIAPLSVLSNNNNNKHADSKKLAINYNALSNDIMFNILEFLTFSSFLSAIRCQHVSKRWLKCSKELFKQNVQKFAWAAVTYKDMELHPRTRDIDHMLLHGINMNCNKNDDVATGKNQTKQKSLSPSTKSKHNQNQAESESQDSDPIGVFTSRLATLVKYEKKIINRLNQDECKRLIYDATISIYDESSDEKENKSFCSIEFPPMLITNIDEYSKLTDAISTIFPGGIIYFAGCENLVVETLTVGRLFRSRWWRIKYENYYQLFLRREIMRVILTSEKIVPFFQECTAAKLEGKIKTEKTELEKSRKNLLLLDWDGTLYCCGQQSPHLIKFWKFVCDFCVVFIDTLGGKKEESIKELNKIDGIHIHGVINKTGRKCALNKWIQKYGWFNIDKNYSNFLLIDDDKCWRHENILHIPKFDSYDDNTDTALLKLMPWLKKWYQYTNTQKIGTTHQYIKSNPSPFRKGRKSPVNPTKRQKKW